MLTPVSATEIVRPFPSAAAVTVTAPPDGV